MPFKTSSKAFSHDYLLYFITILASIVLSAIARAHYQPFNVDGILYLQTASAFLQNGVHAAIAVYPWPFYSILVAITSLLTSFSLENSAFLLNLVLTTTIVISFIALVKECGGDRRTQVFAAIVILLFPYLNHDRDNILRDFGYYAFGLVSILYFIRYFKCPNWRNAIFWGTSIVIATAFRVEGIILCALAPLALFFQTQFRFTQRFIALIKIYLLPLIAALLYLFLKPHQTTIESTHLAGMNYFYNLFQNNSFLIPNLFSNKVNTLTNSLFANNLNDYDAIPAFLYSGMVGMFFHYVVSTMGIGYLLLAYHALRYRLIPTNKAVVLAWSAYFSLSILTLCFFLIFEFFLTDRYILLSGLLFILAVPFSLNAIYNNWREKKACFTGKPWVFPLVAVFLLGNLISSVGHFGTSKTYIRNAGDWLQQNATNSSQVFSNDPQLAYYSHHADITNYQALSANSDPVFNLKKINIKNYAYIAIVFDRTQTSEQPQVTALMQTSPIVTFHNKKGDSAWIFQSKKS